MKRFKKWLRLVRKASPYKNVLSQIFDIIQTKVRVNISPSEYYFYQFYKGDKTWEEKGRYVGLDGSRYWPYELNRLKFNVTLTNKYFQKNLLIGFGLPTPRLITTIGHRFEIDSFPAFDNFLAGCRLDIVIKPLSSMGGHRVLSLTRRDNGGYFMAGENYPPERIWPLLEPHLSQGFLVEEKVTNNRQIQAIYPHSLNCFRVVTIKLPGQDWTVVTWGLKVGSGKSVVDNIRAGGIYITLDEQGRSKMGYLKDYENEVTHHPDTGVPLAGIQFQGADAVRNLALDASRKFGFMGTIGWDIGLTEKGPVIIEGNNLWGAADQKVNGGIITGEMARRLKTHTFFSRWDRRRMFPKFHRKMKAFKR
jgi:hypothetical protein